MMLEIMGCIIEEHDPWLMLPALRGCVLGLIAVFLLHAVPPCPSAVAALGIVVLHFGAMTATTLVPGGVAVDPGLHPLQPLNLARVVGLVTATIVVALAAAALLERLLTDLRGLTQATRASPPMPPRVRSSGRSSGWGRV